MNKILILVLVVLSSCSMQKKIDKAKDVLSHNPIEAAKFCIEKFPDKAEIVVSVDSTGYYETVKQLQGYSDSLLQESDARLRAINNLTEYLTAVEADGRYDASMINELQAKLAAIKPVNTAQLRASIEKQIRDSIKPCKDSLIKIIPTKEIEQLKAINKQTQDKADKFEAKNDNKGKWIWWLIIYSIAMTIFAFRKLIFKLLAI